MQDRQTFVDDLKARIAELEGQARVLDRLRAGLDPVRETEMRAVLTYRIEILSGEIKDIEITLSDLHAARPTGVA